MSRQSASAAAKRRPWLWNASINVGTGPCGSGLAREGVVSASVELNDTPHSRASSLPQDLCLNLK
ncbi:hypothetical protein EMIT0347P_80012 [Pseudomonas sp. IT-347P]